MSKVISWDQYFMGVAKLSAYRSKILILKLVLVL